MNETSQTHGRRVLDPTTFEVEELVTLVERCAKENKPFYVVNVRPEVLIITDLRHGGVQGVSTGQSLRLTPGKPVDLLRFFDERQIKASMSLAEAWVNSWVRYTDSAEPVPVPSKEEWVRSEGAFEAPPNEFDLKLAEAIRKEQEEEDKLRRRSRDPLGASRLARDDL